MILRILNKTINLKESLINQQDSQQLQEQKVISYLEKNHNSNKTEVNNIPQLHPKQQQLMKQQLIIKKVITTIIQIL